MDVFYAELGSIDGNQRLLIKGKYVQKQIESLLKKYIGMCGVPRVIACIISVNARVLLYRRCCSPHLAYACCCAVVQWSM